MQKAEMAEFIRRARREGVPFDEIEPFTARRSVGADGIRARRSSTARRRGVTKPKPSKLENFSARARAE
jgi:hypothetical protein